MEIPTDVEGLLSLYDELSSAQVRGELVSPDLTQHEQTDLHARARARVADMMMPAL